MIKNRKVVEFTKNDEKLEGEVMRSFLANVPEQKRLYEIRIFDSVESSAIVSEECINKIIM